MTDPDPPALFPKLLLVQIRESSVVAEHELVSLCEVTGLPRDVITAWNVVHQHTLPWDVIDHFDGVIIGGAGVHSATNDDDFIPSLIDDIKRLADDQIPTFGSCYGHQIIARALGGEVIVDKEHSEVGCYDVELLENAADDAVFGPLWAQGVRGFPVLMGHNDRVCRLPHHAVEFARSALCPNQAFRIEGTPMWATQFHSELSPSRILERLERYASIYADSENQLAELKRNLRPTPEASSLITRFIESTVEPIH